MILKRLHEISKMAKISVIGANKEIFVVYHKKKGHSLQHANFIPDNTYAIVTVTTLD